jgi:hypothetical protein
MTRKKRRRPLKTLRAVALRPRKAGGATLTRRKTASRYERDVIVMMPVNRETGFVFWEVSVDTLKGSMEMLRKGKARLVVKVHDRGKGRQVCSFTAPERFGSHYVVSRDIGGPLIAEIGLQGRGTFKRLLRSGPCSVPVAENPRREPAPVKWMKKEGETYRITADRGAGHVMPDDEEFSRYLRDSQFPGSSFPR